MLYKPYLSLFSLECLILTDVRLPYTTTANATEWLDLEGNSISGSIPDEILALENLGKCVAHYCTSIRLFVVVCLDENEKTHIVS